MDDKTTNNSRIGVQIGPNIDGNEQMWIRANVGLGKNLADAQSNELASTYQEEDTNLALVIVLTAANGKADDLVQVIETIMTGASNPKQFGTEDKRSRSSWICWIYGPQGRC